MSMVRPEENCRFPTDICRTLAASKINIPFLTFANRDNDGSLSFVVDLADSERASHLIDPSCAHASYEAVQVFILSVFPHRYDPDIFGALFALLSRLKDPPLGIANSPSAVSVVLKQDSLGEVTRGLFDLFEFSAYRTPEDWKLAQKGKEALYKEVIASYQEKKPKIYGLEWQGEQEFVQLTLGGGSLERIGNAIKAWDRSKQAFHYMAAGPGREDLEMHLSFCLPGCDQGETMLHSVQDEFPVITSVSLFPTTYFSMNGPHFGDRDGIAAQLFEGLNKNQVRILGLSCTIASITGILPAYQTDLGIKVIKECFDVPSVMEKTNRFL